MKKFLSISFLSLLLLGVNSEAFAYYCTPGCSFNHTHYYNGRYGGYYATYHHSSRYLVGKDYFEDQQAFPNNNEHSLISYTTIYYYSDGSRRSYVTYSILNKDGTIIESDCREVQYINHNKKHYFVVRKNKNYKIIDGKGVQLTKRNYSLIKQVSQDKLMAKADKKYGLIDLNDTTLIPIKYKSMTEFGNNLFITKLNGYYGILDISGNILAKNEYDSIKTLYDTFLLKKEDKFGLASLNGNIIFNAEYDKIKKLGEFIVIKKDKRYQILNSSGILLTNKTYKKIKLERNSLQGKLENNVWENIEENL